MRLYVSGPASGLEIPGYELGLVDGLVSDRQVPVPPAVMGQLETFDAGSAFPAMVLTNHCTKILLFGGSVVTITPVVSKPLEKGVTSPAGSPATTVMPVTTAEPVRGREMRNAPNTSSVPRYCLSIFLSCFIAIPPIRRKFPGHDFPSLTKPDLTPRKGACLYHGPLSLSSYFCPTLAFTDSRYAAPRNRLVHCGDCIQEMRSP